MRRVSALVLSATCALLSSCIHPEEANSDDAYVVQVAEVIANPLTIQCRTFIPGTPVIRDITYHVRVVNATKDTVVVTGISSHGQTIRSNKPELVGQSAYNFTSLPFTPDNGIVRPLTGDLTYTVTMTTACYAGGVARPDYIDIGLQLFVQTNVGEFVSPVVSIHQDYQ